MKYYAKYTDHRCIYSRTNHAKENREVGKISWTDGSGSTIYKIMQDNVLKMMRHDGQALPQKFALLPGWSPTFSDLVVNLKYQTGY